MNYSYETQGFDEFLFLKKIRILNSVREVDEEEDDQEVKKENVPQLVILDMSCKYFTFSMIIINRSIFIFLII